MTKLQGLKSISDISNEDYLIWKKQAIQNGELARNASLRDQETLYKRQQLTNLGMAPEAAELPHEQLDALVKLSSFDKMVQDKQIGGDLSPLYTLARMNPQRAAEYSEEIAMSLQTTDEINSEAKKRGKTMELSDIPGLAIRASQGLLGEAARHIIDETDQLELYIQAVKKSRKKELKENPNKKFNTTIKEEALRRQAIDKNNKTLVTINGKINKELDRLVQEESQGVLQELNEYEVGPEESNNLHNQFRRIATGYSEIGKVDSHGNPVFEGSRGSNYYRQYEDSKIFDSLSDYQKKEFLATWTTYKETLGQDQADAYTERFFQQYVKENQPWTDQAKNFGKELLITTLTTTAKNFAGADQMGSIILGHVAKGLAEGVQAIPNPINDSAPTIVSLPLHALGDALLEHAQTLATGKNPDGTEDESWYNIAYLEKATRYNTFDRKEIQKAEVNGGATTYATYTPDAYGKQPTPFSSFEFWWDAGKMMGQISGQVLTNFILWGVGAGAAGAGAKVSNQVVSNLLNTTSKSLTFAEPIVSVAGVGAAYGYEAAEETYNSTMQLADQMIAKAAAEEIQQSMNSKDYQARREAWVESEIAKSGITEGKGMLQADTPEARQNLRDIYDSDEYQAIYNRIKQERATNDTKLAEEAAYTAYNVSAFLETARMSAQVIAFQKYLLSGNSRKLFEQRAGVGKYGTPVARPDGTIEIAPVRPLGGVLGNKVVLRGEKAIASYRVGESLVMGGFVSNMLDDYTTGISSGFALGYANSELLRDYDPEAYAETWFGGGPNDLGIGTALSAVSGARNGLFEMALSSQPYYDGAVGLAGAILPNLVGFRYSGRKEQVEQYKQYIRQGGKVGKLGRFNIWWQGPWSEFEAARLGVRDLQHRADAYNKAVNSEAELFNRLPVTLSAINTSDQTDERDFAKAQSAKDAIAMELINAENRILNDPLHVYANNNASQKMWQGIQDIASDKVAPERKEELIQEAWGKKQQNKSEPITDAKKQEIWNDIVSNAKDLLQFQQDYQEAAQALKQQDRDLASPENAVLVSTIADYTAQQKRIARDIDRLSESVGIHVDQNKRGHTQGQLTDKAKNTYIKSLNSQLQDINSKLYDLQHTEFKSEVLANRAELIQRNLEYQAKLITRELELLESESPVLEASTNLTDDAIQLNDMLTNPEDYTQEQREQIEEFRTKIGKSGEAKIAQLAILQDQSLHIQEGIYNLKTNQETFSDLQRHLASIRQQKVAAAQTQKHIERVLKMYSEPSEQAKALALSLSPEEYQSYMMDKDTPIPVAVAMQQNQKLHEHWTTLMQIVYAQQIEESARKKILDKVVELFFEDSSYILDNGYQGVTDMLAFLKYLGQYDDKAIDDIQSLYQKVMEVKAATPAYSEYRIKKAFEQAAREALQQQKDQVQQTNQQAAQEKVQQEEAKQEKVKQEPAEGTIIKSEVFEHRAKPLRQLKGSWKSYTKTRRTYDGVEYTTGDHYRAGIKVPIMLAVESGILPKEFLEFIHKRESSIALEDLNKVLEVFEELGINTPAELVAFIEANEGKTIEEIKQAKEAPVETPTEAPVKSTETKQDDGFIPIDAEVAKEAQQEGEKQLDGKKESEKPSTTKTVEQTSNSSITVPAYKKAVQLGVIADGQMELIRGQYEDDRDGQQLTELQSKAVRLRVKQVLMNPQKTEEDDKVSLLNAVNSKAHHTKATMPSLHMLYKIQKAVREGKLSVEEALDIVDLMTGTTAFHRGKESKEAPAETPAPVQETTQEEVESPILLGVTTNEEGNVETMSAQEAAEQLGITPISTETMTDSETPPVQETTDQQEEVHGNYFNAYESQALRAGELVPMSDDRVYTWLEQNGIKLGNIIDNELHQILKVNPKIQLMKVRKAGDDAKIASNVFLVVEYTDDVAKHHLPENGGVITSGGKQYLIIGNMWNTKAQDGTPAGKLMQDTMMLMQKRGVEYLTQNHTERFYVDQSMSTEVTTFNSGHIINTIEGEETGAHTLTELIDEYNKTHAKADHISMKNLGFGVITESNGGFCTIGPVRGAHIKPQSRIPSKYGQVYVLVPAANGQNIPIFINPILLNETKEGQLKQIIDTVIIPKLASNNYDVRLEGIQELCQYLCISGRVNQPEGKTILIGTKDMPVLSIMNGRSTVKSFDLRADNFTIEDIRQAIYQLNPRINLNLSGLDTQTNMHTVQMYEEAGALTTDSVKLGTFGSKYYVAPIDLSTGKPMKVSTKQTTNIPKSDYSEAQDSYSPTVLYINGNRKIALRNGKWVYEDGSAITSVEDRLAASLAYKVQSGEAKLITRQKYFNYYIVGMNTSNPVVIQLNISNNNYTKIPQELASKIIDAERRRVEKERADKAAQEVLKQNATQPIREATYDEVLTDQLETMTAEQAQAMAEAIEAQADEESPTQREVTPEAPVIPIPKNDIYDQGSKSTYTVDEILTREDMIETAIRIYDIIAEKMKTRKEWQDVDMDNLAQYLASKGMQVDNITNIEDWVSNLETCK